MTETSASIEALRFPIDPFAAPEDLTKDDWQAAIEEIEAAPAGVREVVAGLSDEQLDSPYRPEGWTARQVVHHLADSHINSYIRFKLGLTEEHPTIRTYHEERWAELEDSRAPVQISLTLLEAIHSRWALLLRSFADEDWARTVHHPDMGSMRLDVLLAFYAWHGRHHIAHIKSLRRRNGW